MKGVLLSFAAFLLYVVATALLSRILLVCRHAKLFIRTFLAAEAAYFLAYALTPANLWFLPARLLAPSPWLEILLGAFILALNFHSYFDWFFAFNGGFSTSLLLLLLRSRASSEELIAKFHDAGGRDKIYGWRLPRLEETGYLRINPATRVCSLTPKGRVVAILTRFIKRLLNLGHGG